MKLPLLIVLPLSLAACVVSGGGHIEGVKTSDEVSALMLGDAALEPVAQCIAATAGTAAQPSSQGFSVPTSNGGTYLVSTIDDPLKRFTVKVELIGQAPADRQAQISSCLSSAPAQRRPFTTP